jgi:SAM-dependent methyltransferase
MDMERDSEVFLRAFHARYPGATARTMRAGRTEAGLSSYEILAQVVPPSPDPVTVVDLACGDGYLLELLADRLPGARLVGIDMSGEELAAARERLGPDRAELLLERAQLLPLPSGSVDYLLCHMALMLMDSVEEVVREIRRVLKPGGVFCAVVGGGDPPGGAYADFVAVLKETLERRPEAPLALGDPRTQSAEGLRALFGPPADIAGIAGRAGAVEVDEVVLHLDGPAEQVQQFLTTTYWSSLLSEEEWREVDREVSARLAALCREDGTVPCPLGLRRLWYESRG